MKRLLIVTCMLAVLVFLFTISASAAEIREWGEVDLTYDDAMKLTSQYGLTTDYDARIMFTDGKVYPAWYFARITEKNGIKYIGSDSGYEAKYSAFVFDAFNGIAGTSYTNASLERVEIPSGITAISQGAFHGDHTTNIVTVDVPEGVTIIRQWAFKHKTENVSKLTKVTLPSTLVNIEKEAFYYNSQLEEINIPSGVTEIISKTFFRCISLTKIVDGSGVTAVGDYAFARCPITDAGNIFDNVVTIGQYGFMYCQVREINLIKVKSLGNKAFEGKGADSLTEIVRIGPGATLGSNVFIAQRALHTLVVGNGTAIPGGTFDSRNNVDIPTILYTGANASDLTAGGDLNVNINNITAGVNYCVAFYNGNHQVSDPKYNFVSFIEGATITGSCSRTACGLEASKTEVAPIFFDFKYSAREEETNVFGLVMFYQVNQGSIETYKEYTGKSINYGVMAIAKNNVTNGDAIENPLNADGTTKYSKIIVADVTRDNIASVQFIIKGSGAQWEAQKATEFYVTGYVGDGTAMQYFTSSINSGLGQLSTISYTQASSK